MNALLEFGQELNRFVLSVIRKEITPETQGKKIAGFIEVKNLFYSFKYDLNIIIYIKGCLCSQKIKKLAVIVYCYKSITIAQNLFYGRGLDAHEEDLPYTLQVMFFFVSHLNIINKNIEF